MSLSRRQFLAASASLAAFPARGAEASGVSAKLDAMAETVLAQYPETASALGIDTGARAALRSRLAPRTLEHRARVAAAARTRLAAWNAVDKATLTPVERTSLACAAEADRQMVEGARFAYGDVTVLDTENSWASTPYAVTQMTGAFQNTPTFLDTNHTVTGVADAEAYLARVEAFAVNLDAETARVTADAGAGVTLPDFLIRNTLGQLKRFRARPTAEWGLATSLGRLSRGLTGDWQGRAAALCTDKVAPALDRQIAALEAVLGKATADAGAWKLPDGEAYYAWRIGVATTTRRSPDELHRLGLEQMAELDARLDEGLRKLGYTQGTTGERMAALGRDPANLYANDEAGRQALLGYLNGRVTAIRQKLPQVFGTLTPARLEIRRVPPDIQDGAPNGYAGAGSIDGSRPGIYYINLKDTANWPRFSLPTLTFHEGIPGHVWQGDYTRKQALIRSMLEFNAFSEGWALYSEQTAEEVGIYADDPLGPLGYLQSIRFRACRLVVDTGIHAKRWTADRAADFLSRETGQPAARMRSEVERYCATPGQACGYKVGHNEINRMRDKARAALGPRFDIRRFNDAVVLGGNVPLTALEEVIDGYIARPA